MPASVPNAELAALALLADPLRGRLYQVVRAGSRPVSRDEAAGAVGISRGLAAFHLDKLVDAGLLAARYQVPEGPAARVGRRPKLYEPSGLELDVTIPERRYDLVGTILVDAVAGAADDRPLAAATQAARAHGVALGAGVRHGRRLGRLGPERALTVALEALAELGYQPDRRDQRTVLLRNCPFRTLARRSPEVVCAVNRSLLEGMLRGLGDQRVEAVLAPRPDACCVELRAPRPRRRSGAALRGTG
jgi:predicted ArsR family transcriptional regulator